MKKGRKLRGTGKRRSMKAAHHQVVQNDDKESKPTALTSRRRSTEVSEQSESKSSTSVAWDLKAAVGPKSSNVEWLSENVEIRSPPSVGRNRLCCTKGKRPKHFSGRADSLLWSHTWVDKRPRGTTHGKKAVDRYNVASINRVGQLGSFRRNTCNSLRRT